jgi:N-acetylglucosaminyl-diphospho-decaprenol L-rhamnosyltransferase
MSRLAASIVNYRTPALTVAAVARLLEETRDLPDTHIYVVENDSQDGSYQQLQQASSAWGDRVTLLASPKNGGYGAGNNVAIRQMLASADPPDHVLVLNPDALMLPGSLGRLLAFMDAHPDAGLCGSRIVGNDGGTQVAAFRFPSVWSELESRTSLRLVSTLLRQHTVTMPEPTTSCPVDWVSGSSMLFRTSMLRQVGLFDEAFFLYFEEVDLARRARDAGWRTYFVAEAPVSHIGSASTGLDKIERRIPRYWLASRHRYFRKHHGAAYAGLCDLAWAAGTVAARAKTLLGGVQERRPRELRDFVAESLRSAWRFGAGKSR